MKVKNIYKKVLAVLAVFVLFIGILFGNVKTITTKAENFTEDGYTPVVHDLNKDETFNEGNFPQINDVDRMHVIQIAENSLGELFIYVYQPNVKNSYVLNNIRLGFPSFGSTTSYHDFDLKLVSQDGVFYKYLVLDLVVGAGDLRFYDLVQVSRLDDTTSNTSTISYKVAQQWQVNRSNDDYLYSMQQLEVVVITNKYVGFIRYEDNSNLFGQPCDSHFVAFSTDFEIEQLVGARVGFVSQTVLHEYNASGFGTEDLGGGVTGIQTNRYTYGVGEADEISLSATNNVIIETGGIYDITYEFDEIESSENFILNNENVDVHFTNCSQEELAQTSWVLRFFESPYTMTGAVNLGYWEKDYTKVADVTILELTYEKDGQTFTVGCVDNKMTGEDVPSGSLDSPVEDAMNDFNAWLEKTKTDIGNFFNELGKGINGFFSSFGGILLLLVLLAIFAPLLPAIVSLFVTIIKAIGNVLLWLFKGIWWVLCFPFKVIIKLFGKKEKK